MPSLPTAFFTAANNALSEALALELSRYQIQAFTPDLTHQSHSIIQPAGHKSFSYSHLRYLIVDDAFVRHTYEPGGVDRALTRYQDLLLHLKPGLMPLLLIPDHYYDQAVNSHPFHPALIKLVSGIQSLSRQQHLPILPIFIRDLFTPEFGWLPAPLNRLLASIKSRTLTLEGPPELHLSPITLSEIAPLLLRPAFSPPHHPKALRFTGRHRLTYLNAALAIRSHLESAHHLTLDLNLTHSQIKVISSPEGLETISPDNQSPFISVLSQSDRQLFPGFHKHRSAQKTQKNSKPVKPPKNTPPIPHRPVKKIKPPKKNRPRRRLSPLYSIIALVMIALVLIAPWYGLRYSTSSSSVLKRFYSASTRFATSQILALDSLAGRLSLAPVSGLSSSLHSTLVTSRANHLLSRSLDWADQVFLYSLTGQNPPASSQNLLSEFDLETQQLAHLKAGDPSSSFNDQLRSLNHRRAYLKLLGSLFYSSSSKDLALMLQNPYELRPTGGFLESVALFSLDQGRLVNQQYKSVGELDQALSGQIKPPDDLAANLTTDSWSFRDLNWSPQFSQTAKTLNWFLEKAGQSTAETVIGTTASFWTEIIATIGPLDLDTGQSIDSEAFELKLLNSDSDSAIPNLQALVLKAFLKRYPTLDKQQRIYFLTQVESALIDGEVFLASADPAFARFLSNNQFDASLPTSACLSLEVNQACLNGSIALNEANLGVNRANAYLSRNLEHIIELSPSGSNNHLKLVLENHSQTDAWPMGDYQAYLRLYLPLDLENLEIILNNLALSAQDLSVSRRYSLLEVGINLTVPVSSQAVLEIKYRQPLPEDFQSLTYLYRLKRQPGTTFDSYRLSLTLDPVLKPLYLNGPINFEANQTVYTGPLSHDLDLAIEFLKSK